MEAIPESINEARRLSTLREYRVLDTLPDESIDNLARITAELCNTPISLVSLIDRERQWFKSKIGLTVPETPRDVSFCAHAIESGETLVVEDALHDPRFANNPLVLSSPKIRFYAGVPLRAYNGYYMGTLCVIDHKPRSLNKQEKITLEIFAKEVEKHLELRRLKFLNEELIQMIIHDINNPLTIITGSTDLLIQTENLTPAVKENLTRVLQEALKITRMTDDLLDILKNDESKLINNPAPTDLTLFFQTISESATYNAKSRNHRFDSDIEITNTMVNVDTTLLQRILDNLIDNAIKYSPKNTTIRLKALIENEQLLISVSDQGNNIPAEEREKIFDIYYQVQRDKSDKGLGIGLAFCKLAATCMNGDIQLVENPGGPGTTLRLSIPLHKTES